MQTRQRLLPVNGSAVVIAVLGVIFLGFYLLYVMFHEAYLQGPVWLLPLGLFLVLILSVALVYGGYWVATSSFTADQSWQVAIWVFAGLIGAVALTFWPIFYQRVVGVPIADPIFILLVSGGIGANAGIVAGVAQIRSERQFQQVQQTRDSFEFLNRLLRHNILNAINIIDGNANLIVKHARTETIVDRARTISRQSDQIGSLIQNVRVLVQQDKEDTSFKPIDFSDIVASELETLQETYDEAVIESDLASGTHVRADDLVSAVVENLLANAIEHNDQETPQVDVSLETRNGAAVLQIADNGPGVPDEEKAKITKPGPHGDHGLGLYLVDTLVTQYGGEVRFDDNEPRGTIATVELPTASNSEGSPVARQSES